MNKSKRGLSETVEVTFNLLESEFTHLQTSKAFFVFELFLAAYCLILLALVAERYMLPSLMNIS